MSSHESYRDKLGFTGREAVLGVEHLIRGLAKYSTLSEEEQAAFFADVLDGAISVGVVNEALARVDLPGIPSSMERVFKAALIEGFRVELAKQLADAV